MTAQMATLSHAEQAALLKERLSSALCPTSIDINDDSHQHLGHQGAQSGAGHFTVAIASEKFVGLSQVASHKLVYAAIEDLIPQEIHALRIIIKTS